LQLVAGGAGELGDRQPGGGGDHAGDDAEQPTLPAAQFTDDAPGSEPRGARIARDSENPPAPRLRTIDVDRDDGACTRGYDRGARWVC
jgi:hypothetical protein